MLLCARLALLCAVCQVQFVPALSVFFVQVTDFKRLLLLQLAFFLLLAFSLLPLILC